MPLEMSAEEWAAGDDPSRMLQFIQSTADETALRLFACACCRRIWETFSLDWARQEFDGWNSGSEIRYVGPDDWIDPRPRAAVAAAEAFCRGEATADELQQVHEAALAFASDMWGQWEWASYRQGDAGHPAEFDVGKVTALTAAAARDASDPNIRNTVERCAQRAASVVACRQIESKREEAVQMERRRQADMIRERIPPPR